MANSVPSNTLVPISSLFPGTEAITPDLPPPIPEVEEEDNFSRSVMSTIDKFESSSPAAIRNNNFGNLQYNKGGFSEQFGAIPDLDNPYIDSEGIQRFHAKFPDRESGIQAAKVRSKELMKEVGRDPIKFAERWTGITDKNSEEYKTVINYANEIDSAFLKNSEPVSLSSLVPSSPSTPTIEPGTVVPLEGLVYSPTRDTSPPVKDPKSFFDETVEAIMAVGQGVPLGLVSGSETYARVADLVGIPGARDAVDYLDNIVKGYYDNPQDYLEHSLMGGVSNLLNSVMTGAGGAIIGSGGGPWGTIAGYALSSGTLFSLAEYHSFMDDVIAFGREEGMDEEEIKQFKSASVPEAIISAVAEGGIEAIQALVLGKVLTFTGSSKTLTVPAKRKIKQMAFDFLKKSGIVAPVEMGGEQITTIAQVQMKKEAGLPHPEMWEAMKQTFGPSAVQVFLMGFGGQMIQGRYTDTSQNRAILKQQILDLNEKKGIDIDEEVVDGFLVTVDFMAESKGMNVGDFIGQAFADVHHGDPVEGKLMQRMPDTFMTKASKVIDETWDEEETSESALRKLKNGQVNKHEMEWFGIEDFIEAITVDGEFNITKSEMHEYLSLIGIHAGVEEKIFSSKVHDLESMKRSFSGRRREDLLTFYQLDSKVIHHTEDLTMEQIDKRLAEYDGLPHYQGIGINQGPRSEYFEIVHHIPNSTLQNLQGIKDVYDIPENYNSTIYHFLDIQNVLAHTRGTVRSAFGEADDMLLIEEIQSDIHQRGNRRGYGTWGDRFGIYAEMDKVGEEANSIIREYNPYEHNIDNKDGYFKYSSLLDIIEYNENGQLGVNLPPLVLAKAHEIISRMREIDERRVLPAKLPFSKKWIHLEVKRMITEAIKRDLGYIAWSDSKNMIKKWGDINLGWRTDDNGDLSIFLSKGEFDTIDQLIEGSQTYASIRLFKSLNKADALAEIADILSHFGFADSGFEIALYNKINESHKKGSMRPLEPLFTHIYDNYIPSIIKKVTGQKIIDISNDMYYSESLPSGRHLNFPIGDVKGIAITDKVRDKFLKGSTSMFQGEKGSVEFLEDGRAVLRMAKGADASTLFHELGHIIRRTLTPKELKEVEEWAGVEDGVWTVEAEEKFARGFERWLRTGTTEREELQGTFNNISKWLKKVYKRIKGSPIEGKLSRDMRNLFDRLVAEPNLESVINGRKVIINLGGQVILEDEDEDISAIVSYITSPEFAARKFPVARKLIAKIIEAEFKSSGLSQEDYAEFQEAERLALSDLGRMAGNRIIRKLTPERVRKQLEKVRGALETITTGTEEDIKKLQKESPGVYEAAKILRKYFDKMREEIKSYKKDMFMRTLPKPYREAFEEAIIAYVETGTLTEKDYKRLVEKYKLDEKRFKEHVDGFIDIDNWGIDDYITNMERGTIKLIDEKGKIVAIAMSKREAIRLAKIELEKDPDIKSLRLDTSALNFDPHAELTRIQYWMVYRKLSDGFSKDITSIKNELGKALGKVIKITPTHKFAGPLQKRQDVLEGEMNILDVVYTYSYVIRKKISLDKVVLEVRDKIGDLPKNVRDMILKQLEYAKGKYSFGDRIVDDLFSRKLGFRPLLFTRSVGKIRKVMANLKLGYRPVASFINFFSGQGHTWVKFGIGYMKKGRQFLKTNRGKDWIERQEKFLGTSYAIDTETKKSKKGFKLWQPLGMFSAAEVPNRRINAAAAYLYAKDQGMQEAEAELFARRAVRMIQFTYNATSLPLILRSPSGKLAGQFKPYLVKEIEFIRGLRGTGQILKYLGLQMALAGPRGMIWMLRSITFLGLAGLWDEVEEWMNKEHPDIPLIGDKIPTLSRGVVGIVGGDITMPATVQLPNRPEDWAGPFLSDMIRLYTEVGKPWMEGEKYMDMNLEDWLIRLAPATYYWDQLIQSVVTDDGWVRDQRSGNKLYQVSGNWDRILLSMGVSPTKRSEAISAERLFKKEENLRNRNVRKALSKFVEALKRGGDIDDELIQDLINLGVSRQGIRDAIIRKELPPKVRILKESRRLSRKRFLELYPE